MYTGCKAVYRLSVCRQSGVAVLGGERQIVGAANIFARVQLQACSGFVGQRLHQIAHACSYVHVVMYTYLVGCAR